jgi:aryl-alcohol dehydrogenase-like predicted oxidoreductase
MESDTSSPAQARPVEASGTFAIGERTVHRLGFGAMRITGEGVWGEPADHDEAVAVLRRAVELGVDLIDTADSYGPEVSERLIAEALHPYPEHLVIATKAGLVRTGPGVWHPVGRPEYLKQQAELSRRRLRVEAIDLFQLHRIDPAVPTADQVGALRELLDEGVVRHVGLSEVTVDQLEEVRRELPVVTVQNRYNVADREHEAVLERCEAEGIGFIPWFPVAVGELARPGGPLDDLARRLDATPAQVALAWLLRRSPVLLPIPGTSQVAHLEENCAAALVELSDDDLATLDALADA